MRKNEKTKVQQVEKTVVQISHHKKYTLSGDLDITYSILVCTILQYESSRFTCKQPNQIYLWKVNMHAGLLQKYWKGKQQLEQVDDNKSSQKKFEIIILLVITSTKILITSKCALVLKEGTPGKINEIL